MTLSAVPKPNPDIQKVILLDVVNTFVVASTAVTKSSSSLAGNQFLCFAPNRFSS